MQRLFGEDPNTESLRRTATGPPKSNSDMGGQEESKSREPEKAKAVQEAKEASLEPEKAKGGLVIAFPEDNQSVVTVSSTQDISKQQLVEAAAQGRPTRKRPASTQRENATGPKKKPAAKPAKDTSAEPVKANSWVSSASFGFLKATYAAEKAYVVSKSDMSSKATCLVNIAVAKGPRQTAFVEKILAYAVKKGLKKEQVVAFKNVALQKDEA